jgi:hypothetical protein
MESKSSKKWSRVFLVLVGAALFLFGYYLGLPQPLIDNNEIASEELPQKPSVELQSKNIKPSTKSSDRDREVQENEEEVEEEVKKLSSPKSLEQMLLAAQSETNPIKRSAAYARAFENLNQDNIGQALKAFESLPMGFENMQEYKMLLYAWSQFDPLAAIDYCKGRASGIGAGFATAGVLEGWANRDPESARAWVEDPANAGMAKLYNFGLIKGWANRDLQGATDYVMGLEGGEEVGKLVGIITESFIRAGGFSQASTWADALPNAKLKEGALMNLSRSFSRDRPEDVAGWLESHANEKYSAKAFENLGKRWSETDPESSIDYFSNLPDGKSQEVGIKSSISNWAKQDPLSAGDWLNERESGPKLDSALAAYASTVSTKDGGAAMEWAISISDQKLQQSTIKKVGQEWYRQDKDAVEAWLPSSGLSKTAQKSIRNPPKKNWWQSLNEQ